MELVLEKPLFYSDGDRVAFEASIRGIPACMGLQFSIDHVQLWLRGPLDDETLGHVAAICHRWRISQRPVAKAAPNSRALHDAVSYPSELDEFAEIVVKLGRLLRRPDGWNLISLVVGVALIAFWLLEDGARNRHLLLAAGVVTIASWRFGGRRFNIALISLFLVGMGSHLLAAHWPPAPSVPNAKYKLATASGCASEAEAPDRVFKRLCLDSWDPQTTFPLPAFNTGYQSRQPQLLVVNSKTCAALGYMGPTIVDAPLIAALGSNANGLELSTGRNEFWYELTICTDYSDFRLRRCAKRLSVDRGKLVLDVDTRDHRLQICDFNGAPPATSSVPPVPR